MNTRLITVILLLVMVAMFHGYNAIADIEAESETETHLAEEVQAQSADETQKQASDEPPATIINEKDGTKLILISAGTFLSTGLKFPVNLPAYYIAETSVTNAQYKEFVDATGYQPPSNSLNEKHNIWMGNTFPPELADHPVVNVSWDDAKAYCDWAGLRLPTDLEWEKALRGTDGRDYPWGNVWREGMCVRLSFDETGRPITVSVKEYPEGRTPYGLYNMAGNVWEWCEDWYDRDAYKRHQEGDLALPEKATLESIFTQEDGVRKVEKGYGRVVRGGYFTLCHSGFTSCLGFRRPSVPDRRSSGVGFRCAMDIHKEDGMKILSEPVVMEQASEVMQTQTTETMKEHATEKPPSTVINEKDGTNLILIPAGEFIMGGDGSNEGGEGIIIVNLPAYYIAETTVTNAQYKEFVDATGHRAPFNDMGEEFNVWTGNTFPPELADHPVVNVGWHDAKSYCDWAGLRLPTELEWEKAARGTDGRVYPWGNEWDKNMCRNSVGLDLGGIGGTVSVKEYPEGRSPYGLYNMAGNVFEWCEDWYDGDAYSRYKKGDLSLPEKGSPRLAPVFEYGYFYFDSYYARVVRGGSWNRNSTDAFRCASRFKPRLGYNYYNMGFRCARDL